MNDDGTLSEVNGWVHVKAFCQMPVVLFISPVDQKVHNCCCSCIDCLDVNKGLCVCPMCIHSQDY